MDLVRARVGESARRRAEPIDLVQGGCVGTASRLGTSTRTVKRSLSEPSQSSAILYVLNLDYWRVASSIPANLLVRFTTSRRSINVEDEILEALGDFWFHIAVWDDTAAYELRVPSPYTVSHLTKRIAQIEGVERARVELVDEHVDRIGTLADYLPGTSTLEETARDFPDRPKRTVSPRGSFAVPGLRP